MALNEHKPKKYIFFARHTSSYPSLPPSFHHSLIYFLTSPYRHETIYKQSHYRWPISTQTKHSFKSPTLKKVGCCQFLNRHSQRFHLINANVKVGGHKLTHRLLLFEQFFIIYSALMIWILMVYQLPCHPSSFIVRWDYSSVSSCVFLCLTVNPHFLIKRT